MQLRNVNTEVDTKYVMLSKHHWLYIMDVIYGRCTKGDIVEMICDMFI